MRSQYEKFIEILRCFPEKNILAQDSYERRMLI